MKFNQICRIGAASVLSLAACLGLTACSRDYTVGFLYVTSSRGSTSSANGVLNEYGIDYQTGSLIRLASSGQDTGGRNPVSLVITSNQKNVVVVNRDDSNLVVFAIGTDGKLYAKTTTTVAGSFPTAAALSGDSKFLYVTFTYRAGFTTANPGPGGVEIFPLSYDAEGTVSLGTPVANGSLNYFPLGYAPVGIAVSNNVSNTTTTGVNGTDCTDASCSSYVYTIGQDPNTAVTRNLLAFRRSIGSGAISTIGNTVIGTGTASSTGYNSGILASAIAVAPLGNYLYLTDRSGNQIIAYSMNSGGVPTAITTGPYATQSQPTGLTIDPRGKFLYVANYNASTVQSFAIAQATGALSATAGSSGAAAATDTGPTCVTIENALGIYMYTSNFLGNTVSGMQLNSATGELARVRNTPFPASAGPTCAAAIANGSHSTQLIQ
jgi:DNA-binding beta-propeller fold protein YncE